MALYLRYLDRAPVVTKEMKRSAIGIPQMHHDREAEMERYHKWSAIGSTIRNEVREGYTSSGERSNGVRSFGEYTLLVLTTGKVGIVGENYCTNHNPGYGKFLLNCIA